MSWLHRLFGAKQGPQTGCIAANPRCSSRSSWLSTCSKCGDSCYRCEKCGAIVPGSCKCNPAVDLWYVR